MPENKLYDYKQKTKVRYNEVTDKLEEQKYWEGVEENKIQNIICKLLGIKKK